MALTGLQPNNVYELFAGEVDESAWTLDMLKHGEAILVDGSAEKAKALEAARRQSAQPVEKVANALATSGQPPRTQPPLERRLSLQEMARQIGAKRRT
jgi:hypothetical protein